MNTESDREWEGWAADWQADDEPVAEPTRIDIRGRVRRHTVGLAVMTACEVLVTIVFMGYFTWQAWREPTAADISLAFVVALLFVIGWAYGLWNRRGTWRPVTESTRSFVEISWLRTRRKLRTIRWLPYFVALELVFLMPLVHWKVLSDPEQLARFQETWLLRYSVVAVLLLTVAAVTLWIRRRALRELEELEELRRGLGEE